MKKEIVRDIDVLVCGGGPAGLVAAIASARNGAKTLLIERYAFLGGNLAMYLPILTFHNLRGEQVIQGIPQEIIDRLMAIEGTCGHQLDRVHSSTTVIDVEKFKYIAQEMCLEAGVEILFHSFITDTVVEDGKVKEVIVENKSGRLVIRPKITIDATGDGDVAARAGVPYVMGRPEDGKMQPPTLMFRLGNVDMEKFMTDLRKRGGRDSTHIKCDYDAYRKGYHFVFFGYQDAVKLARAQGDFSVPWDMVLFVTTPTLGEVAINMVKVPGTDSTDTVSMTHAEIEGRRQMFTIAAFMKKYIPGFEQSHIVNSAHQIGVRESRRIKGDYTLTGEDLAAVREFPDTIARGGYMVDLHSPDGIGGVKAILFEYGYSIPYRSLLPVGIENLIMAGRCISADWIAFGSIRVTAICMAVGQGAGTAAAVCIKNKTTPRTVDIAEVQSRLVKDKAVLTSSSMFDEKRGGFLDIHSSVNDLASDGTFSITYRFDNFTNKTISANVELKSLSKISFDRTSFDLNVIKAFEEQVISVKGRQDDLTDGIKDVVSIHYSNGAKVEKAMDHLILKKALTKKDWKSGNWFSIEARPENFSADKEAASKHGARFNVSYDDKGMQFLIDVRDDFLGPSDEKLHKGSLMVDSVELFLDGRASSDIGKKDYEKGVRQLLLYPGDMDKTPAFYHVAPDYNNLEAPTPRSVSIDLESERTTGGYRLCAFVPFGFFSVGTAIPSKLGIDVVLNTVDKSGQRIAQCRYAGGPDNWKDASRWREVFLR